MGISIKPIFLKIKKVKEYIVPSLLFIWFLHSVLPLPFVQFSDGYWLWIPRLGYAAKEILMGHLPILNTFQFCGMAFLADGNTNIFNPTFLFYLFLKPEWAYTVSVLLLFFILLLGIWKYFRERGFSYTGSIIGTLGYAFSGQILFWSLYHGMNLAFTLFPWILFSFRRYEKTKLIWWNLLAFLMIFIASLGGFIQFALISALAAIIEGMKDFSIKSIKETIKNRVITATLGVLSAAVIILPTIEAAIFSHRQLISYLPGIMPNKGFIFWILSFFGYSGELHKFENYTYYLGIILIILAFFGLRKCFREIIISPFFIFSCIFPVIVLIVYFKILPADFQFGVESDSFRGMFVFILMLSILAAKGSEILIGLFKSEGKSFIFPFEFTFVFLVCLFYILALSSLRGKLIELNNPIFIVALTLFFGFILITVLKRTEKNVKIIIFSSWLILLMVVNNISQAKTYISENIIHNYTNAIETRKIHGIPVTGLSDAGRVLELSSENNFEDWSIYYGIKTIGGYGSFIPKSIFLRMHNEKLLPPGYQAASHFKNNNVINPDILAKYGVRYLIADKGLLLLQCSGNSGKPVCSMEKLNKVVLKEGWHPVVDTSWETIFQNPKYVGRAYIVDKQGNILRGAKISKDTDIQVGISLEGKKDEMVILSDSWFPGWECYDNGVKVKGYDANGFKGYKLTSTGFHSIEWVYRPKSFLYGLIISFLSIISFLLLLFQLKQKLK